MIIIYFDQRKWKQEVVPLKTFLRLVDGFQLEFDETYGFIKDMDAIIAKGAIWIKFPQTDLETDEARQERQKKYTFPVATGALG